MRITEGKEFMKVKHKSMFMALYSGPGILIKRLQEQFSVFQASIFFFFQKNVNRRWNERGNRSPSVNSVGPEGELKLGCLDYGFGWGLGFLLLLFIARKLKVQRVWKSILIRSGLVKD